MRAAFLLLLCVPAAAQSGACLADALGGGDRPGGLAEITLTAVTTATLGERDARVRTEVAFRPDETVWTVRLGGDRRQTTRATADSVIVDGDHVLTGEAARHVRQSAWLHPAALALRPGHMTVEGDCGGLLQITLPDFPEPLVVQLDDDGRPTLVSTFRMRGGERVYLSVHYGDYRQSGGVWLPWRATMAEAGVETGRTRVTAVDDQ